jgi:hypothetical protein
MHFYKWCRISVESARCIVWDTRFSSFIPKNSYRKSTDPRPKPARTLACLPISLSTFALKRRNLGARWDRGEWSKGRRNGGRAGEGCAWCARISEWTRSFEVFSSAHEFPRHGLSPSVSWLPTRARYRSSERSSERLSNRAHARANILFLHDPIDNNASDRWAGRQIGNERMTTEDHLIRRTMVDRHAEPHRPGSGMQRDDLCHALLSATEEWLMIRWTSAVAVDQSSRENEKCDN